MKTVLSPRIYHDKKNVDSAEKFGDKAKVGKCNEEKRELQWWKL